MDDKETGNSRLTVDLQRLGDAMNEKMKKARQGTSRAPWICQIPKSLLGIDKKACHPQIVSLGPYHRGAKYLQPMETHKRRALDRALSRKGQGIQAYLQAVRELEMEARHCYEGNIRLTSEEFLEMMVVDGCFILEVLNGAVRGFQNLGYSEMDPVFSHSGTMLNIQRDLILLENQIPMFILDKLHGMGKEECDFDVTYLAGRLFLRLIRGDPSAKNCWERFMNSSQIQGKTFHLLDLLHSKLIDNAYSNKFSNMYWENDFGPLLEMRPISAVKDVIKFKREFEPQELLWDVKFQGGTFGISYVSLDMNMKSLMLNLCAFEQRCSSPERKNYVTSFMIFMNFLIDSAADVEHLRDSGILRNDLGSDSKVVEFFKGVNQAVVYGRLNPALLEVAIDFKVYCNDPSNLPSGLLAFDMHRKMHQAIEIREATSNQICIYRIPAFLTKFKIKAPYPQVVSIGPYHRQSSQLRPMEIHKWKAVHNLLKRNSMRIGDYINVVKEHEKKARACYGGLVDSDDFTETMILDGCFILEFLMGAKIGFKKCGYSVMDPVFSISGFIDMIRQDFILLENQIPIFILEALHGINTSSDGKQVRGLALEFFYPLIRGGEPFLNENLRNVFTNSPSVPEEVPHLLGLVHWMLRVISFDPETKRISSREPAVSADSGSDLSPLLMMRPVSYLKEHGIRFRRGSSSISSGIKLKRGCLKIPHVLLDMRMKSLVINLIAYEQLHSHQLNNNDVTSYMIFMDRLIDTAEDVRCLRERGIIMNSLEADSDIAHFFNRACESVVYGRFNPLLLDVARDVDNFCKNKINAWGKALVEEHLRNPWTTMSIVTAVMLLVLTFLQTFYAMYSYHHPH